MTVRIEHVSIIVALVAGLIGGYLIARSRLRGRRSERPQAIHQILLPFTGTEISRRALDAALRLARAEEATLIPAYLAAVPKRLPLDCSIPAEAAKAMPMLEAIEQRAASQGVSVDARIERGRSYRHALERLLSRESFDRVVVPATAEAGAGFSGDDLVWLLERAPAEVLILRPGREDRRFVTANGRSGSQNAFQRGGFVVENVPFADSPRATSPTARAAVPARAPLRPRRSSRRGRGAAP